MGYKRTSNISRLKNRVILCTGEDVVENDGTMTLTRTDKLHVWADIKPKLASQFSLPGYSIEEGHRRKTHEICMRYRRDFEITLAAWIYEERLQSSPRWYKILSIKDDMDDWTFNCRLVERGDEATPPVAKDAANIVQDLPRGVKL